ncbi:Hypothetical protein SMAX5B_007925 [Scophthalmus maximus]|uniref:Uncharacterized protein n=1 Tax=Scophthalmus maximus TaxID=52904 RepID=A0A2U9C530_SCOMX|nr:Hypothetical protein SMAX5B_007925 [Scophthalmus maximus]
MFQLKLDNIPICTPFADISNCPQESHEKRKHCSCNSAAVPTSAAAPTPADGPPSKRACVSAIAASYVDQEDNGIMSNPISSRHSPTLILKFKPQVFNKRITSCRNLKADSIVAG